MAGASYPPPVAVDPLAVGRDPLARNVAQGPPAIGSKAQLRETKTAIRGPAPGVGLSRVKAMFLTNNYHIF